MLSFLAGKGHETACLALIRAGVDMSARDWRGWTALHCAAYCAREGAVMILLQHKRDLAREGDALGRTPLHLWDFRKKQSAGEGLRVLIEASTCVREKRDGRTQLHVCAASGGGEKLMRMMIIGFGHEVAVKHCEKAWPMRSVAALAACAGDASALDVLIEDHDEWGSIPDQYGRLPLDEVMKRNLKVKSHTLLGLWKAARDRPYWPENLSVHLVRVIAEHGDANLVRGGRTLVGQATLTRDMEVVVAALKGACKLVHWRSTRSEERAYSFFLSVLHAYMCLPF